MSKLKSNTNTNYLKLTSLFIAIFYFAHYLTKTDDIQQDASSFYEIEKNYMFFKQSIWLNSYTFNKFNFD